MIVQTFKSTVKTSNLKLKNPTLYQQARKYKDSIDTILTMIILRTNVPSQI